MSQDKAAVANVLAERYASRELCEIWSPAGKIKLERDLWIAVMKVQKSLGIEIPSEAITAYENVRNQVNLDSIMQRGRQSEVFERAARRPSRELQRESLAISVALSPHEVRPALFGLV